jgi:hypothetical protein
MRDAYVRYCSGTNWRFDSAFLTDEYSTRLVGRRVLASGLLQHVFAALRDAELVFCRSSPLLPGEVQSSRTAEYKTCDLFPRSESEQGVSDKTAKLWEETANLPEVVPGAVWLHACMTLFPQPLTRYVLGECAAECTVLWARGCASAKPFEDSLTKNMSSQTSHSTRTTKSSRRSQSSRTSQSSRISQSTRTSQSPRTSQSSRTANVAGGVELRHR